MNEEINMKNTKKEMLDAIATMQKDIEKKEESALNPEKIKEVKQKKEVIKLADKAAESDLGSQIYKLKQSINNELSSLSEKLEDEAKQYKNLQGAIKLKQEELEDIYGIEKETIGLATLLETQKSVKEEFDANIKSEKADFEAKSDVEKKLLEETISQTKESWEKEKVAYLANLKEEKTQNEKDCKRNKEEYDYKIQREREIEQNNYADKIAKLDKEISEKNETFSKTIAEKEDELKTREDTVEIREKTINDLEQKVNEFPVKLEREVLAAVKSAEKNLANLFNQEKIILEKGFEGEKNVYEAKISALESQVKEQAKLTEKLSSQQEKAYDKIQDIANKAVSSASERPSNITVSTKQDKE